MGALTDIGQRPGLIASLAVHAILALLATSYIREALPPPPEMKAIDVQLITLQIAPEAVPAEPVLAVPESDEVQPVDPPQTEAIDTIHPTKMLAASMLAEPRNAEALKSFGQLHSSAAREQLCGIEAVEQIYAYYPDRHPEAVVAAAFGEAKIKDNVLLAELAAVMDGTDWYRLWFECTLSADLQAVTDFAFRVGALIPADEAVAHDLVFEPEQ